MGTNDDHTSVAAPLRRQTLEQLRSQRILLLDGPLEESTGSELCAQLHLLSARDPRTEISLWINFPGGSAPSMLAISDTMQLIPNAVSTWRWGWPAVPASSCSPWAAPALGSPSRTPAS